MAKSIILTGDRPTGKLHLGHFVGSLENRLALQNSGDYETFIMIADIQALTDNAKNPQKVRENVLEVALDYLAVGIDPEKSTILIQSQIPALSELTMYYMNLVSLARLERNPTVKTEIAQKDFGEGKGVGVPIGFVAYPVSQASDITAFKADTVPVGEDQLPVIEVTREIVRTFNSTYGKEVLVEPKGVIPTEETAKRLPGIDGNAKMSKSLGNGIYLADDEATLRKKIMSMYTDPNHIKVSDPGKIEGNMVFLYLDVFARSEEQKARVVELKAQYQRGGLGDVAVKNYLFEVLNGLLAPIRTRRLALAQEPERVMEILRAGTARANAVAEQTLREVKQAIGIDYFGN